MNSELFNQLRELHSAMAQQMLHVAVAIQGCDTPAARTRLSLQVAALAEEITNITEKYDEETT